jgi:hypothetical protein
MFQNEGAELMHRKAWVSLGVLSTIFLIRKEIG